MKVTSKNIRPLYHALSQRQAFLFGTEDGTPLIQSSYDIRTNDTAQSRRFNSITVLSAIGLERITTPKNRTAIMKAIYNHISDKLGEYTVTYDGKDPILNVTVHYDDGMDEVGIDLGDGENSVKDNRKIINT